MNFREFFRQCVPPFLITMYRLWFKRSYGFSGDYLSWEQAKLLCQGYEDDGLFERVKIAALKVKSGEFFSERDSFLFKEPQYSWASLSCLMAVAARDAGRLSVLDFGGSLGSSYFLNRRFLTGINCEWSVVEQEHFVEFGAEHIADKNLSFFRDVAAGCKLRKPNVLLLSSVLQYLPAPQDTLDILCSEGFPYIIVDRTPFNRLGRNVLKIQRVDPLIYEASYPAWTLDESNFIVFMEERGYRVIETFDSSLDVADGDFIFKGFFFQKVKHEVF